MTPAEARGDVVAVLKRAMFGPTGSDDTRWPGAQRPPVTVTADQAFPDFKAISEALVDEAGQEVLRTSPTRLYGVGVLFPEMTEEEEDELDLDQNLTGPAEDGTVDPVGATQDADGVDEILIEVPEPKPVLGEADEDTEVDEARNRPRSMAVSFHVPPDVAEVTVTLTGGRYERLPVVVNGSAWDLWRRLAVEAQTVLAATPGRAHADLDFGRIVLRLGVDSRPLTGGGALVTVYAANMTQAHGHVTTTALFQTQVDVTCPTVLPYPTAARPDGGVEDASFDLLYRKFPVTAVGHGCDAEAVTTESGATVRTLSVPIVELKASTPDVTDAEGRSYAVGMRDLAAMNDTARHAVTRLIDGYRDWIAARAVDAERIGDPRLRAAADRHVTQCRAFLADVEEGWRLVQSNPDAQRCLQWTSQAMDAQRTASAAPTRATRLRREGRDRVQTVDGVSPHTVASGRQAAWRPFQIAFVLASLAPVVDPDHRRRDEVDVIWMPTGGGKTEAYLGLAAFTMLWQRIRRVRSGSPAPGVDVLMRYTLRLLTVQQVQRAAALMCALEMLRRSHPDVLGDKPLRIGAYLGRASTPNSRKQASALFARLDADPDADRRDGGFLLTSCPWCGAEMGPLKGGVAGYRKVAMPNGDPRVVACCPDPGCPFTYNGSPAKPGGLPVLEVDEDIYAVPPAFLVGTIDKFAQLAWNGKSRRLFGLGSDGGRITRKTDPPALLIQDELHLIAGPLGSLDALYEVALQRLCEHDGGRRPRIVAATATTRNYDLQTLRLYGRDQARLVPPPGLDVDDSFFARTDESKPGKVYVGVSAPGFGSNVQAQLRVLAALVHAGGVLEVTGADPDPWWTNVAFFSSRRSLGLQLSAVQSGLDNALYALTNASGVRTGRVTEGGRTAHRSVREVKELTATSRDDVTRLLAMLGLPFGERACVDLCFATSMIEVGVDVPRLGLMTVMGQPKSYSQYIQVTGRVGRTDDAPGLVVVVLSPFTVRDRSHYETFTASHRRLYASVEPVSVTPFTPQALERGLAGALASVLRTTTDVTDPTPLLADDRIRTTLGPWVDRATAHGNPRAVTALEAETVRLLRLAHAAVASSNYLDWDGNSADAAHPFLAPIGEDGDAPAGYRWEVPRSMRSVDRECGVTIPRGAGPRTTTAGPGKRGGDAEEDFE